MYLYIEEKYFDILNNFEERRHFTKFRISNHNLAIETGRYSKPKTLGEERYCLLCNNNKVETEQHMIFECPFYSDLRTELKSKLESKIDLSITSNTNLLMKSVDDEIIFYLSKYIWKSFYLRNKHLSNM